jgi:hypothetical protein
MTLLMQYQSNNMLDLVASRKLFAKYLGDRRHYMVGGRALRQQAATVNARVLFAPASSLQRPTSTSLSD